jgi:urea carboxylase-associated protein 2
MQVEKGINKIMIKSEKIVLNEILYSSVKWSKIVKRGQTIQLKALGDNASLSAMFYNSSNVSERFNSADTVKVQWNAFLGKDKVLLSEMGRVLFAITDDTTDGLFDTLGGISNDRIVKENFTGEATFESCRNGYFKSDRENFLIELGKYGMGKKDMIPALNLFRKVDVKNGSKLVLNDRTALEGDIIELTAQMDVLLILSNTPHAMDKGEYNPSDIEITIFDAVEFKDEDYANFSEEAKRGFQNTNRYFV